MTAACASPSGSTAPRISAAALVGGLRIEPRAARVPEHRSRGRVEQVELRIGVSGEPSVEHGGRVAGGLGEGPARSSTEPPFRTSAKRRQS